jgi:TetR/AcrR family transcriptional regulator
MATRRLKAGERRKQILKCATRIFAASNFKTATTKQIASELGISEAAIFNYFPTKRDIFLAIIDHVNSQILNTWEDKINGEGSAEFRLRGIGISYFQSIKEHADELKVQFQAVSEIDDPEISKRLREHHQSYIALIENLINDGIQKGEFTSSTKGKSIAYIFDALGVFSNLMHLLGNTEFNFSEADLIMDHLLILLVKDK